MYLPDYKGGSIVNLMSSIGKARGAKMQYKELRLLPAKSIKNAKNIIMINVDGLGYDWLMSKGKESAIAKYCRGHMTSTFPSTTAAASTCYVTGLPAQQTGMTGWFEYIKEVGMVITPLPFVSRVGHHDLTETVLPREIFNLPAFSAVQKTKAFVVTPDYLATSAFSKTTQKKAKTVPYTTLSSMTQGILKSAKGPGKKYIYCYVPHYDSASHEFGSSHPKAMRMFKDINKEFVKLITRLPRDSIVILSADHGEMDIPKKSRIFLDDHPRLQKMLSMPLCAEPRLVYCYVKPAKKKEFERYIKTRLGHACRLYKSGTALKRDWFGLGKPHPALIDRIGDYILVMKGSYVLRDMLAGAERHFNNADHGGVSRQEMLVPLVVARL